MRLQLSVNAENSSVSLIPSIFPDHDHTIHIGRGCPVSKSCMDRRRAHNHAGSRRFADCLTSSLGAVEWAAALHRLDHCTEMLQSPILIVLQLRKRESRFKRERRARTDGLSTSFVELLWTSRGWRFLERATARGRVGLLIYCSFV